MMRTMANSPAVIEGYLNFNAALSDGALLATLREQIAIAGAEANGCNYCLSAHHALGKMAGLKKELWGFRENRMAVRFEYEWHDESGEWYRAYGNEMREFNPEGLMARRFASINDAPIREDERRVR